MDLWVENPLAGRQLSSHANSAECFRLVAYWIQSCLTDHEQCRRRATPPPLLPTRYLNVDSNPPRLCVAENGARGFYVALSHCWGKTQPLSTTSATIADRLISIPTADMPQTFRDAVLITRELGLEYLWIDSLCIVQDSQEDWEKESAKMGDIYSNSFLTISAAAAEDGKQGIFQPRPARLYPPVELQPRHGDYNTLFVDMMPRNTLFETPQPVDTRAWCLQETTLAPRVLVYGAEMLGWLCDSGTKLEHGYSVDHAGGVAPPLLAPRLRQLPRSSPKSKALEFYHLLDEKETATRRWAAIVNQYTTRRLTFEKDRLPALSGLARTIQEETGDEYLAGLWKRDLGEDLLWKVDVLLAHEASEWRRPAQYRAPSWSWAAIEGPV
ncbi:HET-domain-containing protein, partial [Zopfia rhizophila CBS 207.26]